jgi:heptose I phosphotransferase
MAAGELLGSGGKLQSFLAVEELKGMLALHEAIPLAQKHLDPLTFQRWKRSLAAEMARLSLMLHKQSVFHKDLYLCHFFIAESACKQPPASWPNQVYVIDLHRLAHHSVTWLWWLVKDLAQLLYSSEITGVTVQDRLTFWRHYRKGMGSRCGLLKRFIRMKWRMYRRHNEKRKSQLTNNKT